MKLLDKRVVIPHGDKRAPIVGFATYTHATKPHLLRRHGWEIADDIHDDVFDISSTDNGATWSKPEVVLRNFQTDRGTVVHIESAAVYVPARDRLVMATNRAFQPNAAQGHQMGHPIELRITVSKPEDYRTSEPLISDFGLPNGLAVSFCQPIVHSSGRIIMPVQTQTPDPLGTLRKLGIRFDERMGLTMDYGTSSMLIGEFCDDDHVDWHLGSGVPIEPGLSSRGLYEPTVIERADGSLVAVLRGSNGLWPDKPGYKWMSVSHDAGETWSPAQPLPCTDGSIIESSSTGSLLLRSHTDGQLYWIGNLCLDGVRPNNNMPRSPIVIARVQEDPFALIRDSIFVIDRAQPHEHPEVQHSNFKAYQDRTTGDVVLYFVRYGERGYADNAWLNADHYQYRVQLHD
jgi:hypothetical protein